MGAPSLDPSPAPPACPHDHAVAFYDTDRVLVDRVLDWVAPALRADGAAVLVATPAHREAFTRALARAGLDAEALAAAGRLVTRDASELLAAFTDGDRLDEARFRTLVGGTLRQLGAGGREIRVYGEMVALLWAAGHVERALELEGFWNALAETHDFALLCGYPLAGFEDPGGPALVTRVCDTHGTVIPGDGWTTADDPAEQRREVVLLQQERAALRADIARLRHEQALLTELAYVDALTGLANRRAFHEHLEREWSRCRRDGTDAAVLVVDLDGLKRHNDRHGHAAGDDALRRFADALRAAARPADLLGRIGGDEFGAVVAATDDVWDFEGRVRDALAAGPAAGRPPLGFCLGGASLGAAASPAAALACADEAMLARKGPERVA